VHVHIADEEMLKCCKLEFVLLFENIKGSFLPNQIAVFLCFFCLYFAQFSLVTTNDLQIPKSLITETLELLCVLVNSTLLQEWD